MLGRIGGVVRPRLDWLHVLAVPATMRAVVTAVAQQGQVALDTPPAHPSGLAADGDGSVVVADAGSRRVLPVAPAIAPLVASAPSGLQLPAGVPLLADGGVVVADPAANRVWW